MSVRSKITGSAVPVIRELETLDARAEAANARGLDLGLIETITIAQNEYLGGPRPLRLGEVTGRLRRSLAEEVQVVPGRGVVGRVGTTVPYGAFHEFGFSGTEHVRAHRRVLKVMTTTGKTIEVRTPILDPSGKRVGWKTGTAVAVERALSKGLGKGMTTRVAFVKPHDRQVHYVGRPFLGPALAQNANRIRDHIANELGKL